MALVMWAGLDFLAVMAIWSCSPRPKRSTSARAPRRRTPSCSAAAAAAFAAAAADASLRDTLRPAADMGAAGHQRRRQWSAGGGYGAEPPSLTR